jgi:hypothetical protein
MYNPLPKNLETALVSTLISHKLYLFEYWREIYEKYKGELDPLFEIYSDIEPTEENSLDLFMEVLYGIFTPYYDTDLPVMDNTLLSGIVSIILSKI